LSRYGGRKKGCDFTYGNVRGVGERKRGGIIKMSPSVSKKQQRYFGMVEAGKIPMPQGMSKKAVEEFAGTPRKGLPVKVGKKGGK
jgi:hypothetical protein